MKEDDEIIRLRTNIRQAAEAKVANGTLTVTEMLREVTAESLARQTQALHKIELLMTSTKRNILPILIHINSFQPYEKQIFPIYHSAEYTLSLQR